jgi:hypothetical protein
MAHQHQTMAQPSCTNMPFRDDVSGNGEHKYETGARRETAEGKGRFDLNSPVARMRRALRSEVGAGKYDDRNWEKGQPLSKYLDHALRHLTLYQMGYRGEDHLAAAGWNIDGLMHTEDQITRGLLPRELDDLPRYVALQEVADA